MSDFYVSVLDFKANTGIALDDNLIEEALVNASQIMKTTIFLKKVYKTTQSTNQIKIDTPVADYDLDGIVTTDDFLIYELDETNYVTPEVDIKNEVVSFVPKYGYITLSADYPTAGKTLVIEAYIARFENDVMTPYLKRLNILLACDYLFTNIPISILQNGISSWNLNGVSVSFDMNSFARIKESVSKEISRLVRFITPIVYYKTTFGFGIDDFSTRSRFTIGSPSGNLYRR